jgi:hypothetical protein
VNPTNLTTTPPTNNGTTNIAPNYASLLTLLATNPTDPTIAAAFIEFLQQKNNNNPNIIAPPTPTFTSIITDAITSPNTLTSPGTPSYSSVTTGHHFPTPTSTNDDEDIEEEDPILSQTDLLPLRPTPTKSTYIHPSSGIITSALEEQRLAQTEDLRIQTRRATEKRVYNHQAATKRRCVIVKFAMATNATSDQAPLPSALEQVIDSIISNLDFNFYVDVVAIINYSTPVLNARKNNSSYYSFIYVSPRSTQIPISNTYSKEFAIVHARLADLLKGPLQAITNIPDLPEITRHLHISLPNINAIGENLTFLIDGIGPRTILGNNEYDNVDTCRHLGFLIYQAFKETWKRTFPTRPLHPDLSKLQTRFTLHSVISVKKVRIQTPESTPNIKNMLGVIITDEESLSTLLRNSITELCITHNTPLQLFGPLNPFSIRLHLFPSTDGPARIELGRQINTNNHKYHLSHFKIIPKIRIHLKFIHQLRLLTNVTFALDGCIALFCDFSEGQGDLRLTAIFDATRTTSFLGPATVTSLIIDHFKKVIDLTPPLLPINPPPPMTNPYNRPPSTTTPPRGRGRGGSRTTGPTTPFLNQRNHVQIPDRSHGHYRANQNNVLQLYNTPNKQYHVIINGGGGIAVANIYQRDFDSGGLRHLLSGVSFSINNKFSTFVEAFALLQYFYPHITCPDDADYMNANCCHDTSNLNNPSPQIINQVGPYPQSRTSHSECFHFDELTDHQQALRRAATNRRILQKRNIMDSYTFEEKSPPPPNNPPNPATDMSIASSHDNSETLLLSQPQHHPSHQPIHHPLPNIYIPTAPPTPPPCFPSEIPTGEPNTQQILHNIFPPIHPDDDDMLQSVTDNTDHLSINEASQSSQNPAPNKRVRPTTDIPHHNPPPPSTIQFSTDIHTDPATILSLLTHQIDEYNEQTTPDKKLYIKQALHIDSPDNPKLLDEKVIYLTLLHSVYPTNANAKNTILNIIRRVFPSSLPLFIDHPPIPHVASSISKTTIPPGHFPLACQVTSCHFSNAGHAIYPNSDAGMTMAQLHGQHIHSELLLSLPPTDLLSIGWHSCCTNCTHIFLRESDLTAHRSTCTKYQATTTPTTPSPFDHSTDPIWALVFHICPHDKIQTLNEIISLDPLTNPQSLLPTVTEWFTNPSTSHASKTTVNTPQKKND